MNLILKTKLNTPLVTLSLPIDYQNNMHLLLINYYPVFIPSNVQDALVDPKCTKAMNGEMDAL